MKSRDWYLCLLVCMLLVISTPQPVHAERLTDYLPEFHSVEMTYYTETGKACADTSMPKDGRTCAYMKEYQGYTAIVYSNDNGEPGEFIGFFEVNDTGYGRDSRIRNEKDEPKGTIEVGATIDIYKDSDEAGKEFIHQYGNSAFVQFIYAEG